MDLYQLGNAAAIYAAGFVALFVVFALLYRHAYASRGTLGLTPLEAFDAKNGMAHQIVSISVGLLSLLIATVAPLRLVPLAPAAFALMGPAHWLHGGRARKKRRALEANLAPVVESVDAPGA
jgi:hypothetical protein